MACASLQQGIQNKRESNNKTNNINCATDNVILYPAFSWLFVVHFSVVWVNWK